MFTPVDGYTIWELITEELCASINAKNTSHKGGIHFLILTTKGVTRTVESASWPKRTPVPPILGVRTHVQGPQCPKNHTLVSKGGTYYNSWNLNLNSMEAPHWRVSILTQTGFLLSGKGNQAHQLSLGNWYTVTVWAGYLSYMKRLPTIWFDYKGVPSELDSSLITHVLFWQLRGFAWTIGSASANRKWHRFRPYSGFEHICRDHNALKPHLGKGGGNLL